MADLVHRRGYQSVGVDDVCKAAGVKKGSFYHFFTSKCDLMLAALDQRWDMVRSHMRTALGRDLPPLTRIERFFAMVAELESANKKSGGHVLGCPFGNVAIEMSTSEPPLARRADEAFCGFAAVIREALSEAKARGELERNIDLRDSADAIVAYFEGLALLAKTRNDPSLIHRLGARAVQLATRPTRRTGPRRRTAPKKKP